jgi:hypothetical protein
MLSKNQPQERKAFICDEGNNTWNIAEKAISIMFNNDLF